MNARKFALVVLAYVAVSFALGVLWYLVLFKDIYFRLGIYNRPDPIFAFGLGAMLLQGAILAYLFPFFNRGTRPVLTGVHFGLLMGAFMWSVTVLAFAAKTDVGPLSTFFTLSTLFHVIQFLIVGALTGGIYGSATRS